MNAASNQTPSKTTLSRLLNFLAKRHMLATVTACVAVFIFARFSAEFNEQGRLQTFDRAALTFCATHRYPPLYGFAWAVSWLSNPWSQAVVVGAAVLLFTFRGRFRPQGATVLVASLGGAGVIAGLKYLFHHPRPEEVFASLGYSFPSGHTFMAVVVYGVIAYWIAQEWSPARRRIAWIISITLMLLVGWSRIYLGEHYPSDVGAAYSAATAWLLFCRFLAPALRRHTPENTAVSDAG